MGCLAQVLNKESSKLHSLSDVCMFFGYPRILFFFFWEICIGLEDHMFLGVAEECEAVESRACKRGAE